MTACFIVLYFISQDFEQKWYFPQGVSSGVSSRMQVIDTDRDGNLEFIFTIYGSWPVYIHFYELHLPNTWDVDSSPLPHADLLFDSGDFDNDGFYDLILTFHSENPTLADGIMIFESPDSFSYPTQEVWRDTAGPALVSPICSYDVDRDGIPEMIKLLGGPGTTYYIDFIIYESLNNNAYEEKYSFESPESPTSAIAFGDFDSDSINEFVMGTIDGQYSIFESPANDSYIPLYVNIQLPTLNIKDCFSVPDMDGDGKWEFVVKGFVIPTNEIHAFIFEAVGDNTYEIFKSFTLPGGDYHGGYSDAGDVDGDSIPEIVLEGCQNVYIIKSVGDDSFYIWDTLPGNPGGCNIRVTHDIDQNGLNEIMISGNNETRIYEYDPGVVEEATQGSSRYAQCLEVYPNPFSKQTKICFGIGQRAESRGDNTLGTIHLAPCLKIYDATGRSVKSFSLPTSSFLLPTSVVWDGADDRNRKLPGGVYFICLTGDTDHHIVQVVKIR